MNTEIKKGVYLEVIPTKKYKTTRVMIRFSTPIESKKITQRTLLSSLMETNSKHYPTQQEISEKLADLYGANFGIQVNKQGNFHLFSIVLNVVTEKYLSTTQPVLKEAIDFLEEILYCPNITAGRFDQETFEREKNNLKEYIDSIYDDKQLYAAYALEKLYFTDAGQQIPSFGRKEDLEEITAESLVQVYQTMLSEDEIHISVIGDVNGADIADYFKKWPLTDRNISKDTPLFYKQKSENIIREKVEVQPVVQSKLNIAYHTGIYLVDSEYFALQVFNGLFGGFPHSRLFINVRERESLAYYASSSLDTMRGIMTVQTGIDGENRKKVMSLIARQLESLQKGNITAEELEQTKVMLKNRYLLSLDSPVAQIEKKYLQSKLSQANLSAEEWMEHLNHVSAIDVKNVAQKISMKAIYFMEGESV